MIRFVAPAISLTGTLCCSLVSAAEIATAKTIQAVRIETPPLIDGRLDEPAWQLAAIVEDLHEINPDEFAEPAEASRFYVLYGRDAIYIAARLWDSDPDNVIANVLRQGDFSFGDDSVTIVLDPHNNGRSGYMFDLNPNSIRSEALFSDVTMENWDWRGIWHGAAKKDREGWVAEIEIPFKTLSFDPRNDTWGINFTRWRGRGGEYYGWVSHNRAVNPANSGKLQGLAGLEQGLGLDVVPSLRVSESKDFETSQTSSRLKPSIDVFYKPTAALTAALTLNTDFSGTGADARQINLSRFDLFFPERRDFFLQDTDIFEFGRIGSSENYFDTTLERVERESGRPFFSRRIGLDDSGATIDLDVGGKLTGRVGRWDIGILDIQQAAHENVPASNLFVGRAASRVLAESMLGIIVTDGDPGADLDNSLVGLDFRYLNTRLESGRTLQAAVWYQQTRTDGLTGDDAAFGMSVKMPNGQGFRGGFGFKELQENFNPALGFVNRSDVRDYTLEFGHTWRPDRDWFRAIYSGVDVQRIETIAGVLQSQVVTLRALELETASSDKLNLSYTSSREQIADPFEISAGIIIPPGLYSFDYYCIGSAGGEHRHLSGEAWFCDGDYFDGDSRSVTVGLTWRPSPHLHFAINYDINDIKLPQGDFTTRLASLRANVAFSSTWSWENFLQYDNVSDSLGLNSILRWLPRAGREMVLVINREFQDTDQGRRFESLSSDVALKISYTFRF